MVCSFDGNSVEDPKLNTLLEASSLEEASLKMFFAGVSSKEAALRFALDGVFEKVNPDEVLSRDVSAPPPKETPELDDVDGKLKPNDLGGEVVVVVVVVPFLP